MYMKELVKAYKPAIFATLETRIHSSIVFDFLVNSSFTDMFAIEALGYSGGIWLLWNANMASIEVLAATDQAVTALVTKLDGQNWLHTVVYASPNYMIREDLWNYITELGKVVNMPWVMLGGINQPLEAKDKHAGRPINRKLATRLRSIVDMCHLMDMGFQGPHTWSNGREGRAKIKERIDRAWCNAEWNGQFDRTCIKHLLKVASDHHPLLLTEIPREQNKEFKGFRFIEAWFLNPEFPKKVEEFWIE